MGNAGRQKTAEIRIEGVSKIFGDLWAVRDVSLQVKRGDFFTFLGPSGCGKTTLLRMIAGFVRPDGGDIYIDDVRVNELPPWKREVGMVFQNFALWPHMSVFDNVAFGLRERKVGKEEVRERVERVLKMVDLEGMGERRPSQLSGGQQQRVALARTLVVEPRGLLLDEPLSSLDARLRVQMRNELVRIQQELGITTIYVTHDQEEALSLSTRIAVFERGEVVQEGTPQEVYEAPQERHVADFVGISNFLEGEVVGVEGEWVLVETREMGRQRAERRDSQKSSSAVGAQMLISVRPESLRIMEEENSGEENRIAGKVVRSTYLGSVLQYDVEVAAGKMFKVNVSNPRQMEVLESGARVELTYSPGDAVLLDAEGDPA